MTRGLTGRSKPGSIGYQRKIAAGLPADFPLWITSSGRFTRKIRGKHYYFGNIRQDPAGVQALAKWNHDKEDLLAGRPPRVALFNEAAVEYMLGQCRKSLDVKCGNPLCEIIIRRPRVYCCFNCFAEHVAILYGRRRFANNGLSVGDLGDDEFILARVAHLLLSKEISIASRGVT
jgi:hypothetical protein